MKQDRKFPIAIISKKAENTLRNGHVWVYDTEIREIKCEIVNGCIVDVVSEKGTYMGSGFISENSKIRLRILSKNANETFGPQFFARRVKYAIDYRRTAMGDDFYCCRLIFGEADGLPGLTVDRYNNIIVTEVLSYGAEQRKDVIYRALYDELKAECPELSIYERNESQTRALEGLEQYKGWYKADYLTIPESPVTQIIENGIKYSVDVENGQKTGFFLDQKYNRLAAAKIAKGKRVLDCFTHTGSFAMNAAAGGAAHVTAVDISQSAIDMARSNVKLNGFEDRFDFMCCDVFELLPKLLAERPGEYDYIILDPPAFTKSRKTASDAERGYKEINYRAMRLLPRGGYLATCSCSHFMDNERFRRMLISAAHDADVQLRLIEERRQGPDHPILMNVPETDYLKFYLFQIV